MSASDRDTARIVRSWLEAGATQLPDRVLDAVLDQLPDHRQRQSWWLTRRFPQMNTAIRVVLAAAAAVVVAGGIYVVGGLTTSPAPSPTVVPTPETSPTATPTPVAHADQIPFADIALEPGAYSYYGSLGGRELRIAMTVPAGWTSHGGWYVYRDPIPTGGNGVRTSLFLDSVTTVYPDPCQRDATASIGTTAAELAAALAATPMHDGADPIDITVSGYAGKEVHISSDPTIDVASCPDAHSGPWEGRWTWPGTEQTLWILDVEGSRLVIDASAEPGADASQRADLEQILQSIQIEVS